METFSALFTLSLLILNLKYVEGAKWVNIIRGTSITSQSVIHNLFTLSCT